jgi:hypothetical protein
VAGARFPKCRRVLHKAAEGCCAGLKQMSQRDLCALRITERRADRRPEQRKTGRAHSGELQVLIPKAEGSAAVL